MTPPDLTYLDTVTLAPTLAQGSGLEVYRRDREKLIKANRVFFGYSRPTVSTPRRVPWNKGGW